MCVNPINKKKGAPSQTVSQKLYLYSSYKYKEISSQKWPLLIELITISYRCQRSVFGTS